MKLIIDIPEDVYKPICDKYGTFPREMKEWGLEAIKNGIPLEQIRAEINDIEEGISSYHNDRPWVFKDEVLQIIDKYKGDKE